MSTSKVTSWLGVVITAAGLLTAAAVAHGQVVAEVTTHTARIEELESQNRALLYNTARICERLGIDNCR
jgi:hypothetical protein